MSPPPFRCAFSRAFQRWSRFFCIYLHFLANWFFMQLHTTANPAVPCQFGEFWLLSACGRTIARALGRINCITVKYCTPAVNCTGICLNIDLPVIIGANCDRRGTAKDVERQQFLPAWIFLLEFFLSVCCRNLPGSTRGHFKVDSWRRGSSFPTRQLCVIAREEILRSTLLGTRPASAYPRSL